MTPARDLGALVRFAREAEEAGVDGVMVSEHVVMGPSAISSGPPQNPRAYALPGNQDPATPWPASLLLLAAIATVTTRLRLVAGALIAPLRHPLLSAKELATLDLLSNGRLVVLPTVSWHRDEYAALGVPFERRGDLLDEQLEVWQRAWREGPASFDGRHYRFRDAYVEPKPSRSGGPVLWFGGSSVHPRLIERIVRYGQGFNPLGWPPAADVERLRDALRAAARDPQSLEFVGGARAVFPDATHPADLGRALESVPQQLAAGFTTFCVKPSQFIDDPRQLSAFCNDLVRRLEQFGPI